MQLINTPACDAGQTLLQEMLIPQPITWLAGLLLISGLVLLSSPKLRNKLMGQSLLFGGLLVGTLPMMNRMMVAAVDCSQPEQLVRLSAVIPAANVIAVVMLIVCVAGVARSLWLLKHASAEAA